jgi:RNA polymerase sigma factor (sigma-70 family)
MTTTQGTGLFRQIRRLAAQQGAHAQSDLQLLQQFMAESDETAFAAIVQRHGTMVLAVCQGVLRHRQDAEDVFQAAFLVLARKAHTIRKQQALASWLHGVAYRLALKARTRTQRLRQHEHLTAIDQAATPADEPGKCELRRILNEELAGLAEKYRAALLLSYWENKTRADAAGLLGMTPDAFKKCLERARNLLASRLMRRGLVPSAVAAVALLSQNLAQASVPSVLVQSTSQLAVVFAAGAAVPTTAAVILAQGAIRVMTITKWTSMFLATLSLIAVGAGVGFGAYRWAGGNGEGSAPSAISQPAARAKADKPRTAEEKIREAAARTTAANNMKQIGLAMHNYHDSFKALPAHAIYSKDGKTPLLSWRVSILPFIDQNDLYKQFKLDEPWDSAHNKKLIPKMPDIFEPTIGKKEEGKTLIQVFTGPDTVFNGAKRLKLTEITDGTSNTIMAVEAKDAVVWTKPADLVLPKDKDKLPALGGRFSNGFHILMCDGTVNLTPLNPVAKDFRSLITPAGND